MVASNTAPQPVDDDQAATAIFEAFQHRLGSDLTYAEAFELVQELASMGLVLHDYGSAQ